MFSIHSGGLEEMTTCFGIPGMRGFLHENAAIPQKTESMEAVKFPQDPVLNARFGVLNPNANYFCGLPGTKPA
jgi:hypothetical protein